MFRITQDPSSGSGKLYWTEITCNGSIVLVVMCVVGVWWHILYLWCVCMLRRVQRYFSTRCSIHTHTHTHTRHRQYLPTRRSIHTTGSDYAAEQQQRT
jgi:hypothetical protein